MVEEGMVEEGMIEKGEWEIVNRNCRLLDKPVDN